VHVDCQVFLSGNNACSWGQILVSSGLVKPAVSCESLDLKNDVVWIIGSAPGLDFYSGVKTVVSIESVS
jgi:hypothetical protein